ncbi:hypothetical protein PRZ48_014789 [Zasmidium cellare]|uniref:Uncharacterized protein n=1 Tax=Zasmidium cellare TaxID=395010 RepID=A0ABR0DZ87_ZASCE|nr:hypothetical protein PRZ48_014789 [Zasmidium cellare]
MKLTTALLATAGLAAAAPTAYPPKPIDTPFVPPVELEEPKDFHEPATTQPVEPVGNPTPAYVPEKPVIPENATLDEVKEYIRQWAEYHRLRNEPIDWDSFHAAFPHGRPPYWNRFPLNPRPWPYSPPYIGPVAKRADAPAPEDPLFPTKMTDEELKESIQPKDEDGKPYHLWDDRFPWITRFGKTEKRAELPPGFPPIDLTADELLELFRPGYLDGEHSPEWIGEKRADVPEPPEAPVFPAKMTDEELIGIFGPNDEDGKPFDFANFRLPKIAPEYYDLIPLGKTQAEKRADVPEQPSLLEFLKANPHMHVMSVKPIAKRTDGPEDYDLTEEEDLERDMCHVTLWDAMSGQWPEKVWECYEWHHLEDDGWNAGAWELD